MCALSPPIPPCRIGAWARQRQWLVTALAQIGAVLAHWRKESAPAQLRDLLKVAACDSSGAASLRSSGRAAGAWTGSRGVRSDAVSARRGRVSGKSERRTQRGPARGRGRDSQAPTKRVRCTSCAGSTMARVWCQECEDAYAAREPKRELNGWNARRTTPTEMEQLSFYGYGLRKTLMPQGFHDAQLCQIEPF